MKLIIIHNHSEADEKLPLEQSGLHPSMVVRLAELGVIEITNGLITPAHLRRAYRVLRLGKTLNISLAGASIAVELLERMEEMQEEINRLQREVQKYGL